MDYEKYVFLLFKVSVVIRHHRSLRYYRHPTGAGSAYETLVISLSGEEEQELPSVAAGAWHQKERSRQARPNAACGG